MLAKAIRKNDNISGILVNNKEIKLSQYADDTTLILDGSRESLTASLKTLDDFYEISGLKLNDKKTEALWIGANCGNEEISLPGRNFKWPKHKVKALGVWLSVDPEATATLNYNEKLDKIRNILSSWKYRRLTLIGKIAVLKSLVASQLVYVLSPLRTNAKAIKEVNKLFFSFLWNDKGDKIKRDIMINDYSNGGLKMLDIESFSKSLKATWIKKYLNKENRGKWKLFFDLELEKSGGATVLTSNLNTKDTIKTLKINNQFVSEVLTIWAEVNFEDEITSESQFLDQSLWHNSLIRINNHPIFYREWFQKGVLQVKHLKDGSNYFLSLTDLQNKYSLNACPLGYCGLLSALKRLWNTVKNKCTLSNAKYESFLARLLKSNRASPIVYTKLISKKSISPTQNQQKWIKDCNLNSHECINWRETNLLTSKCAKSTRLVEFQFKLLHRRLSTNEFLNKIGINDNPKCSFCDQEPETLVHLFWSCPKVASFWNSLNARLTLSQILPENYTMNISVALGLMLDSSKSHQQLNFCYLMARHFIWICKRKETSPQVAGFLQYLKSMFDIEVKTAHSIPKKWDLLSTLF